MIGSAFIASILAVSCWLLPMLGGAVQGAVQLGAWSQAQPQLGGSFLIGELTANQIEAIATLRDQAFTATRQGDFEAAETHWTDLLELLPDRAELWSNRGNIRVGQNQLEAALADYGKAIELAPEVTDTYLNRGAALEGLHQWEAAIADYDHVLDLQPNDAAAYNNRGNAKAGMGQWEAAIADYDQAARLEPNFALARVNHALALYQTGQIPPAIQELRFIVRKYPQFADARAALTAALWVNGQQGEAESHWVAASGLDRRYKDITWVREHRRWPTPLADALERFLTLN